MTTRYRLDPGQSRVTAQAFAAGVFSFLGHSPTFLVRDFAGTVSFEGGSAATLRLDAVARADGLELLDQVRPADREDIEGRMRKEVLETAAYPEIGYEAAEATADAISQGRYRLRIGGRLSLHGVTRPYPLDAEPTVFSDGIRLEGAASLRMSDFRIQPVTALGGTIKLKDEGCITFNVAGIPEGA